MSELENLLNKTRLNQNDINKISKILLNENPCDIGNYLMNFSPKISKIFFKENFPITNNEDNINAIVSSIITNEKFLNNTRNDAINRTFPIIGEFLKKNILYDCIADLLVKTFVCIAKKTPISNTCDNLFNQYIFSISQYNFFNLKLNFENEYDKECVFSVITHLINNNTIDRTSKEFLDWSNYYDFYEKQKIKQVNTTSTQTLEDIVSKLTSIEDILNLNATNNIEKIENEPSELDLQEKINLLEKSLELEKSKTNDLTNRLKEVLNMSNSTNNQELLQLKNEISKNLKLEYEQFQNNKNQNYSVDLFEANRGAIIRIFRVLQRLDIEF